MQIPGACFVNTDLASQLYAEDLISREEYAGIMRSAIGLAGQKRHVASAQEEKAVSPKKPKPDNKRIKKDKRQARETARNKPVDRKPSQSPGDSRKPDHSVRGKVNASKLDYAKESTQHMRKQSAVLHPEGKFVVAPNGAGKSYYVKQQAQNDWLDQDPYLEQVDIPTRGNDKLSKATMQQADKATLALKRAGAWVLGATWWDPANVDAFVVPSAAVIQTRLAAKPDKFDENFYANNVEPQIETIRKVAKEHEIPIYDSFEDIVVS